MTFTSRFFSLDSHGVGWRSAFSMFVLCRHYDLIPRGCSETSNNLPRLLGFGKPFPVLLSVLAVTCDIHDDSGGVSTRWRPI